MDFIDRMPPLEIDADKNVFVRVDGGEKLQLGLIHKLVIDEDGSTTIEKWRVFVPGFKFESPWENLIGSDSPSEDEATEDYNRQRSKVFLDKKTRKPILYKFVIDKQGNLYLAGKRVSDA